jgi:hypothetical protein
VIHLQMQGRMHREQLIREAEQAREVRAARVAGRHRLGRPLTLAAAGFRQWLASAKAGARTGPATGDWSWSGTRTARRTR